MSDMDEIVKEFLVESTEGLDQLDRNLVALEQKPGDKELLAGIFRSIHTIKGTSGFLAFSRLESVTHVGESLLSDLRDGKKVLTPAITSALLQLVDAVRSMLAAIEATGQDGQEDFAPLVELLTRLQTGEAGEAGGAGGAGKAGKAGGPGKVKKGRSGSTAVVSLEDQASAAPAASAPAASAPAAPPAASAPPAVSAASTTRATPKPSLKALRAAALGAKSAEEKARVRALAEQAAQDSLNAISGRSFPSAQEARAAGTALQVALRYRAVSERLEVIAWRCNAFSCEHPMPGGMSLCSDPSRGGVPLTRVITEETEGTAEFTT